MQKTRKGYYHWFASWKIVFLTNQCTMIYTVFDKVFVFSHPFWDKVLPFHTPFETKLLPFHTPKNCTWEIENAPPQQQEQRFPLRRRKKGNSETTRSTYAIRVGCEKSFFFVEKKRLSRHMADFFIGESIVRKSRQFMAYFFGESIMRNWQTKIAAQTTPRSVHFCLLRACEAQTMALSKLLLVLGRGSFFFR